MRPRFAASRFPRENSPPLNRATVEKATATTSVKTEMSSGANPNGRKTAPALPRQIGVGAGRHDPDEGPFSIGRAGSLDHSDHEPG